ncbi:MAG: hypothetical protein JWP52_2673 [Rhizobacter sp.]|nr:hypothetical protein [Rhizobacter sp.]
MGWSRRVAWTALVAVVIAAHLWISKGVADQLADLHLEAAMPARIEVAYVRELAPTAPVAMVAPVAPAAVPAMAEPAQALPVEPAASQPEVKPEPEPPEPAPPESASPEPVPEPPPEPAAAASSPQQAVVAEPVLPDQANDIAIADAAASSASEPQDRASETQAAEAASAPDVAPADPGIATQPSAASDATTPDAAKPFEWPLSTRLSYVLTGYYRGPVEGSAQVEWVLVGPRYQVHLDVSVGPDFAPIIWRRMTSDGEVTPQGLSPKRYDDETRVMFGGPRRNTVLFERDAVVLPDGSRRPRMPDMQDQASQFVQLTYLFSTRPELLVPGQVIDVALALPRKVDTWHYEVLATEPVQAPFGSIEAVHVKPRRTATSGTSSSELSAEVWFAPTLAYLPVRIRIEQTGGNFIDLVIAKLPQQAGR